jgi:plasmid stabilization system protein ParE
MTRYALHPEAFADLEEIRAYIAMTIQLRQTES